MLHPIVCTRSIHWPPTAGEVIGQKPDRFGYISFGAGRHRCPGTMFFGTEASIVFQRLFGRMDIDNFSTEFPTTRMAAAFLNRPAKPTNVYIRTRAAAKDVPCYQPADGIDQALDIPIDELVADGSEDNDDILSSLNETSRPSCPVSGIGGGVAAAPGEWTRVDSLLDDPTFTAPFAPGSVTFKDECHYRRPAIYTRNGLQ